MKRIQSESLLVLIYIYKIGMTMEFSKLQFEAGKYDYSITKTIDIPDPNQSDGSVEKTLTYFVSSAVMNCFLICIKLTD